MMTTRKTKQLGAQAPFCIFNYKRVIMKKQILFPLLAIEIALATLFVATRNNQIVIAQVCITIIMMIIYKKQRQYIVWKDEVKKARKEASLTQAKMNQIMKVPLRTIQSWEAGDREPPEYVQILVLEKLEQLKQLKEDKQLGDFPSYLF